LPASASCARMLGQNHSAEPNPHVLTFLHPKFVVKCTGGVALRKYIYMIIKFSLKLVIQQSLPNCKRRLRELAGLLDICDSWPAAASCKAKKTFNWVGAGSDVTLMSLRVRHTF